jgi:UDPglucose--hexose-1-phosphate uridylyltransferase
MITFNSRQEIAEFHLPGEPDQLSKHVIDFRIDPLTGTMSVLTGDLLHKKELFFGRTDHDLIRDLADRSREGCFFCPEKVTSVTPLYPSDFLPKGRLMGKQAILFPNLFPLAKIHAVVTNPTTHFLPLDHLNREWFSDIFSVSSEFISRTKTFYPELDFISINMNHLPPAGASLFHPHVQIFGSEDLPSGAEEMLTACEIHQQITGKAYWDELVESEMSAGDRWIGNTGEWNWLTAFAPQGANEIIGVHTTAESLFDVANEDFATLSEGIANILRSFHASDYSSFNFSVSGGTRGNTGSSRVIVKVITRQNFTEHYRTDDYFLQRFMGIELMVVTPEVLARTIRDEF